MNICHREGVRRFVSTGAVFCVVLVACAGHALGFGTKAAISVAREDLDADNVPDHLGSLYEIKGRITRWNYNTEKTEIFLQDTNDNAGILVFNMDPFQTHLGANYSTGKEVTVSGYIEQTNGVTALRPQFLVVPQWVDITDSTPVPIPPVCDSITNFMSDPEAYEGTLVCISNVTVSSGSLPNWNGWGICTVSDGADEINLFIDDESDIDGQLSPTGTFDIVGIFSQYDTEDPLDGGYQIWPRWYRDFQMTTNNQRPQIHVEDSNTLSAAAGDQIIIEFIGQDRNPGDDLLMTVLEGPGASVIATNGNREYEYRWTPAGADAGKSTNVVLHVSDGSLTNTVTLQIFVLSEEYSNIRLNEIHWDPVNNILGDADGSGDRDYREDEFVEIVNNNADTNISMGGWKLKFGTNVSFTFPANMVLTAETAVVLFGGGTPQGTFGGAQVFSPATWAALANSPNGEKIILETDTGTQIFSYDYGPFYQPDQSITRDPDATGDYRLHTELIDFLLYSPGTMNRGRAFPGSGITNMPPLMRPMDDQFIGAGKALAVSLESIDPETNAITLTMSGAPASANLFDSGDGTGTIAYTGQVTDAGTDFNVEVYADDGTGVTTGRFTLTVIAAQYDGLIINEYMADPNYRDDHVDSNMDGNEDAYEDEFVEIVNNTTVEVDIVNCTIENVGGGGGVRHTFPSTILEAGEAVVVFGGGDLGNFTYAQAQLASSGSLSLRNSDDIITLKSPGGGIIDQVSHELQIQAQSYTRYPDLEGGCTQQHYVVTAFARRASPGRKTDYSYFLINQPPRLGDIEDQSASVGIPMSFTVSAREPDSEMVTLAASNLPANATFTPTNAVTIARGGFAFTPSLWQIDQTFTVDFYASDSNGTDTQSVNITVSASEYDYFWDFEDQTFQGWTAHSQASDDDWYIGDYDGNYFAAINGYGADVASKDWLVSPALDLASMDNPVLSFLTAKNYEDVGVHEFVCRISTNYDGSSDPWTSGDWTDLSATLSGGGWSWTNSGDIDLSAYKQTNTYLAYYYECSGTTNNRAETWEVDDIGIADGGPGAPDIAITNPVDQVSVSSGTTTYDIQGSAGTSVIGSILWSNMQQGTGGSIPAEESWTVSGIGLGYGENVIVVYGTNNSGAADSDAVTITRPYSAAGETNSLIISEIADPANSWTSRFVEIYNTGTGTITFAEDDWTLARQANGTGWADIPLSGSIAPSSTHVVAYNALTFQSDYGKTADQVSTNITGNGDDGYFLYKYGGHTLGALIDAYGVIDEDGTTQAWEYVDGRAVRNGGITEPNATWTAGEWIITNATTDLMTPCVHPDSLATNKPPILDPVGDQTVMESNQLQFALSASDPFDGDTITLTASNLPGGAEFGSTNENGLFTWAVPTAGTYNVTFWATDKDGFDSEEITITVNSLAGSQLLISEVADPQDDYTARFVELYNAGSVAINLGSDNWYLSKQTGDSGNWSDASLSGTVDPGDTFVIANDSANFNSAYGQMPDDDNSSVVNGNGDDVYALYKGGDHSAGTLIDMYGVMDQDGTGQDWEYTDGRAYRKAAVTSPNDTWTSSEWMIYMSTGTVSVMTPGVHPDGTASNEPPVLASIGNQSVTHSNTLNFVINASDPVDGDPITLTASNLPVGAVFSPTNENGSVRWTNAGPVGVYTCQFFATDQDGFDSEEITITVNASGGGDTPLDISGYEVKQYDSARTYTIPADTDVNPGGYVIIARNADQSAFETFWGVSLGADVVFLNSGDTCPMINGGETYELTDGTSTLDGPSGLAMTSGNTVERNNTTDDGTAAGSWSAGSASSATPGSGASGDTTAGLVINEYSDAGTYDYEFVELYYDSAGGGGPAGLDAPVIAGATDVAVDSFKANWSSVSNATGYLLDVATNDSFSSGGSTTSTLVDADFQTDWDGFSREDLAGAQFWDRDDAGPSGSYYAMMNGWSGGAVSNEDWLISPALDLDSYTGEVLTFKTARGTYADIDLDLFISTNYSGSGNPYAATWTPLAATFADYGGASWTWTDSGNIDLSGFAGSSVYVGFRYGSTSSSSEKWEVDDVLITGISGGGASHYVPGYEARHAGTNYLTVTGLTEGVTYYYRVRATNDADTSDYSGTTNVTTTAAANTPPVLQAIGHYSVEINDSLVVAVTATDADNDDITHTMSNAPAGSTLSAVTNAGGVTNTFNWAVPNPVGVYTMTFYATDFQTQDWEQITIEVYGLDRDGDGIPNDYEDRYDLGSTVSNSSDDADSDGYPNIDEYIADTIPTNDQSFFYNMITNYNDLVLSNGYVHIMIGPPTTNSRIYDVWWSTNITVPPIVWTPFNLDIPGDTDGGPVWATVTNTAEVRFYRTGVKLP